MLHEMLFVFNQVNIMVRMCHINIADVVTYKPQALWRLGRRLSIFNGPGMYNFVHI